MNARQQERAFGYRGRLSPLQAGLAMLVAVGLIVYFGFTKANPFANPYELKAAFTNAQQITPRSPVRIAGVPVGKVTHVELIPGGRGAVVTMEIKDKGLPIHRDARAKIRPRIFLEGNWFVDLEPGSPSAPSLPDGATLPITQTAAPVTFGRFLDVFKTTEREDLRTVFRELGTGLSRGGGSAFNRATQYWEPAFRDSAVVAEASRGELAHDLSDFVRHAGTVAAALDRDPAALKRLVASLADVGEALANEDDRLERAIANLDDTLGRGVTAFRTLRRAFPPLRRLVGDLRPAARAAKPALTAQLPLLRELRRLVAPAEAGGLARELRPLLPQLVELNRGGVGLQEQLRLLSSCQLQSILPTGDQTIQDDVHPASGPVYQEGVKWLPGIAAESRSFDANGQFIKTIAQTANYAYASGGNRFFGTTTPLLGINPPARQQHPPLRPDVPCETQDAPDVQSKMQAPPTAIKVDKTSAAYRARAARQRPKVLQELREILVRQGTLPASVLKTTKGAR